MRWVGFARPSADSPSESQLTFDALQGLGKTMQTIALICTDDTGEGVLAKPEDPDERFDDMTLIGERRGFA